MGTQDIKDGCGWKNLKYRLRGFPLPRDIIGERSTHVPDDRNAPATKGDVQDVLEAMRDIQTELLKAFYNFARSNEARLTEAERESAAVKERLAIVESRLTELERRIAFPGQ